MSILARNADAKNKTRRTMEPVEAPMRLVFAMVMLGMIIGATLAPDDAGESGIKSLLSSLSTKDTAIVERDQSQRGITELDAGEYTF